MQITSEQLRRAAAIKEQIETLEEQLQNILGGGDFAGSGIKALVPASAPSATGKRRVSAASKAKMAAAQRARWAKIRGESSNGEPTPPGPFRKKKRQMSPEGRERIAAAARARWRKAKAAGKNTL